MRKNIANSALAAGALFLPFFASAAAQDLNGVLAFISKFANNVVGLLITIALIVFFWGLIRYVLASGEAKGEGLQIMLWGVIAVFVMVSIWGIIKLLQTTFGVQNTTISVPQGIPYQP
ncbi:hypothetical protein A3H16_03495 [Candidatus Kaiserbacteria bacterium RIFCSPLOWO2_12_FULL_53_8]|uniref:Uncharacterized protein n=2 Tax=Candidatus Kaiseribacteriota TaxID=1752734 RepID=A0A1F6CXC0_9BACT|nr:MAG: hypothetical protein A2851_01290 [Candidatus Kaiserbacteria bacterium RIFCSPHIGHO2_01_FULL_53_29]OGG91791.1 MAG: hypothetical protein A3H16_03495 [Candidatus Kaiserbacteria bacterium RIFCSPLOWO2_12_FULL_53_8]